jgi:hypothetical protein
MVMKNLNPWKSPIPGKKSIKKNLPSEDSESWKNHPFSIFNRVLMIEKALNL